MLDTHLPDGLPGVATDAAPASEPASAATSPEPFADGLYFGLEASRYHADPALGSSDLKRLAAEPAEYWFASHLNPARPADEQTPSQALGSAVHKLVLEGRQAFDALYVRRPDDLARLDAKAKARLAPNGETVIPGEDFDRVLLAAGMIQKNPHIAAAMTGGAPEVSVFWTDTVDGEPVRRKARFDYLKPRALVDLKSVRPTRPVSFEATCHRAIADWNYPTQAAAYLQGRAQVSALVAAGHVFGDAPEDLPAAIAAAPDHAFVFVFWASTGAPMTWGGVLSPENPILDVGRGQVDRALWHFVDRRRRFGLEAAWVEAAPLAEISIDDLPRWWGQ